MNQKIIIAIDPDLHKSGLAVYNKSKLDTVCVLTLWQLFDFLHHICIYQNNPRDAILVLLEYPFNTNTYHKGGKGAALNVGKNQAIAIVIKEFLDSFGCPYKLLKPAGYSNFFKDKEFFKKQTGWKEQTNGDSRAAVAMLLTEIKLNRI